MRKMIRYGLVAVLGHLILFTGVFLLVEIFNLPESLSYFIIITFDYAIVYVLNLKFVLQIAKPGKKLGQKICQYLLDRNLKVL